jgi:hypothetical protein
MKMRRRELIGMIIMLSVVIAAAIHGSKNLLEAGITLLIAFGIAFAIGISLILISLMLARLKNR